MDQKQRVKRSLISRAARLCLCLAFVAPLLAKAAEPQSVIHMLVPGFTVQELPVHLSNINNIRFAPDGRLFALGYDGRVHVLRDTNGDGLEDTDEIFWDKPTISIPVGMAITLKGGHQTDVYISSHGKVSVLRANDGDGKADTDRKSTRLNSSHIPLSRMPS